MRHSLAEQETAPIVLSEFAAQSGLSSTLHMEVARDQ
jgi:hypothetical protein